jgi:hypothetical protein
MDARPSLVHQLASATLSGPWHHRLMRHRSRSEVVLVGAASVALTLAIYFRLRYGDAYRIGDSEHRRVGLSDQLAYLVPSVAFALCVGLGALRRLCGGSITMQWRGERHLLQSARWEG